MNTTWVYGWAGIGFPAAVVEFIELLEFPLQTALLAVAIALSIIAAFVRPWQIIYRRNGAHSIVGVGIARPSRNALGLRDVHGHVYKWIAGSHPQRRIWHSQWLSVKDLYRDLRRILPTLRGRLVDVGCLAKPYARWLTAVDAHVGLDISPSDTVDHVIRDGEPWPLESNAFQSVLCTQVLQVVKDLPHLVNEIDRVLDVGGIAVITAPFLYNDMTMKVGDRTDHDYWRHSFQGVQELFANRFDIIEARRQGGFGSTSGVMLLNWVHKSMSHSRTTEVMLLALLPVWLLVCLAVNAVGCLLDRLDRTEAFYHNVLLVLQKKAL
jgi:SAM-dependent methyltransferase